MGLAQTNNNPGNVKTNAWVGEAQSSPDPRGHAIFTTVPYGVRAMVRTLARKYNGDKKNLILICSSWAPVSDGNDPLKYAETVGKWTGLDPYLDLHLFHPDGSITSLDRLIFILKAFTRYEDGKDWVKPSDWLHGISLYVAKWGE